MVVRLHGRGAHYVRSGKTDPVRYGEEPDRSMGTYVYGKKEDSEESPATYRPTGRVIRVRGGRPEGYRYTSGGFYMPRKRKPKRKQ